MLRSSNAFWLTCALGAAMSGCTTAKNYDSTPVSSFDQYYGQPQANTGSNTLAHSTSDDFDTTNYNDTTTNDQTSAGSIELQPDAPSQYTVKKGDTLWAIAGRFLKKPWQWPEIWDKNKNIKNPHWIYPGDIIYLSRNGISINQPLSDSTSPVVSQDRSGNRLRPSIRVERGDGLIGEPISTLAAFTLWPKVMSEAEIKASPYIVSAQDNSMLITEGEKVYLKGIRYPQEGMRCAIYHPEKALHDPDTGRLLGYEVTYGGFTRIERPDPKLSTGVILENKREIHSGDRLLEPVDETVNLNVPMTAPTHKVRGTVISLFDADYISGSHMVAVINRGSKDGIQLGYTLGVYDVGSLAVDPHAKREGKFGEKQDVVLHLPPEKVANMVIFKVDKNLSYGLIMQSSREVQNGYKIGNP